jgi:DNA-binding IclR family transcriptional regulator
VPAEPSPAVVRAAQVLKTLAAQRGAELSLSALARRVGVHRSSCQTLLLALCAEGLVRREPGGNYRLGPVLVELGEAARAAVDSMDLVDRALIRLRDEFGTSALAGVVAGDSVVIASAHPVPHPFGYSIATGTRLPLRAPVGPIYVAWADAPAVDAWCARADPPLSRQQRLEIARELATIRQHGWSVTVRPGGGVTHGRATTREATKEDLRRRRLAVIGISAPVWSERGALVCSLALAAFPADLSGSQVRHIGARLKNEAACITEFMGGSQPSPGHDGAEQPGDL